MTNGETDVETALDGIIGAVRYCENNGHDDLSEELNSVYQELGKRDLGQDDD